jgi:hypothetical protein
LGASNGPDPRIGFTGQLLRLLWRCDQPDKYLNPLSVHWRGKRAVTLRITVASGGREGCKPTALLKEAHFLRPGWVTEHCSKMRPGIVQWGGEWPR